ncbi:MAG TPA: hemolysin family protein [Thermoleophilia bacterium]|nr:hemolysin family protein [Thermoleophilia bacterium]
MNPISWFVIAALLLANALYVAAEFAAVGARRHQIRLLARDGNRRAAWVLPIVEDTTRLDRYVAACQIGITFSSLVLGAFSQATLARDLKPLFVSLGDFSAVGAQTAAALVVLIALTTLQVVLGELLPKSLALQFPTRSLLLTVPAMRASLRLMAWSIWLLNGSGLLVLNLLRAPRLSHRHIHSPEEIDLLIAESRDGGLLEPDEQRRLHQALRLSMYPVSRVMVPHDHVVAVDADSPFETIVATVAGTAYTRLPVYRGDRQNIVGLLRTKEVALAAITRGDAARLDDVLQPIVTVAASTRADELLTILRERHSQQAIVLDDGGGMAGLVTVEDVLEEVFGEVSDEFKGGDEQGLDSRRRAHPAAPRDPRAEDQR